MVPSRRVGTLGTRFPQVELQEKTDVCTQLHKHFASCTEFHCSFTVQSLCNRAGAAVTTALSLPHFIFQEKPTTHLPNLQWFCKEMLFTSSLEVLMVFFAART